MFELYNSGYEKHLWKRMLYIASEDVGLGDPLVQLQVKSLHSTWEWHRKEYKEETGAGKLFTMHALLLLVRANKSRLLDDLLWVREEQWLCGRKEKKVPKFAYDMFTLAGKKMGRGLRWFFEQSAKLRPHNTEIPGTEEIAAECAEMVEYTEANKGKLPSQVHGLQLAERKKRSTITRPAELEGKKKPVETQPDLGLTTD